MNKLTKISAVSLFALCLTACDKPAEKAPQAAQAQQTTQQSAPQNKQVTLTVSDQNIDDVKKFLAWDAQQMEFLKAPQDMLKVATEAKDVAKIQDALKQLSERAQKVLVDADKLDIKDATVNLLKDKAKENLVLSLNFVNESFSYLIQGKQPSEEEKQKLNTIYQHLAASSQELQQVREQLYKAIAPKQTQTQPAQEPAKK
ncbi:hypothetical protein [Lonepinella sp. BR2474]|uniref:hypothetical protein n=1 Tax=Lonepinella sp. BR2474 TaxID=3434548 RepID=UPI003F6E0929